MFDLKRFRKENKISQKELSEVLGVAQSFISQIENGKDPMPEAMLQKISDNYKLNNLAKYEIEDPNEILPPISRGELKDLASKIFEAKFQQMFEKGEIRSTKNEENTELHQKVYESSIVVKLVTTKARAGFAGAYYADEYLADMPTLLIEADKEYKGKYLAFEVDGDSMEPEYTKGDIVICREIKRDLWQYKLHYKDWDFVIAHGTKGIMLKEIVDHNVETGEITCHSLNQEGHPDFVLNLREVAYLYNVVEVRRSGKSKRQHRYFL